MAKVLTTYVPHAASAERNWSSHIRHHTKSINQFKAKNVEKMSMVKHQYRKKKTLSNKKVAAAYQKLLHPTESISTTLLFQANSNSLNEIRDDDEVETEVNTRDDGQLIVIDGGDDVINGGDDKALNIQVAGEAAHAQKEMDGLIADIRDVLRRLKDDLDTFSDSEQTPETYISSEEDDGDEEEEEKEGKSIATWFWINCDGLKDFDLSLIQVTTEALTVIKKMFGRLFSTNPYLIFFNDVSCTIIIA